MNELFLGNIVMVRNLADQLYDQARRTGRWPMSCQFCCRPYDECQCSSLDMEYAAGDATSLRERVTQLEADLAEERQEHRATMELKAKAEAALPACEEDGCGMPATCCEVLSFGDPEFWEGVWKCDEHAESDIPAVARPQPSPARGRNPALVAKRLVVQVALRKNLERQIEDLTEELSAAQERIVSLRKAEIRMLDALAAYRASAPEVPA